MADTSPTRPETPDDAVAAVPEGYEPLFRSSPFLELIGPLYHRHDDNGLTIGLRLDGRHVNARGAAHGGVLLTLADIALGYSMAFSEDPPLHMTTASMSVDFAGSAQEGDWVVASTDIQKIGGRLAFANAYISVGDKRIVRASGVFARADKRL